MNAGVDEKTKGMELGKILEKLSERSGLKMDVDLGYFRSTGDPALDNVTERQVISKLSNDDTIRDVLEKISSEYRTEYGDAKFPVHYTVKGKQVVIGPGFHRAGAPLGIEKQKNGVKGHIPDEKLLDQLFGKTMTLAVSDYTLDQFVDLVCDRTGATVVVNRSSATPKDRRVTVVVNCVSTLTALRLAAEFEDLAVTNVENVFYIAPQDKIDRLNIALSKSLYIQSANPEIHVLVDRNGRIIEVPRTGWWDERLSPRYVPVFRGPYEIDKQEPKK